MTIELSVKPKTIADIEKIMREKFPGLPDSEIVGSQAWKRKVQAEQALSFKEKIEGVGKIVKTPEVHVEESSKVEKS